jgi:outer membrane protein OmpA-like peptidoglycan-associated protein
MEFLNNYIVDKIKRPDAPNLIIYLEGHTDDVGDANYNMQLSQKRVQAIADFLISMGIKSEQIKVTFFGESKPETGNIAISKKLKDIRYANRRVVVRLETE